MTTHTIGALRISRRAHIFRGSGRYYSERSQEEHIYPAGVIAPADEWEECAVCGGSALDGLDHPRVALS